MGNSAAYPRVGVVYRATDTHSHLLDVAQAVAERGFSSFVLGEHTHIPVQSDHTTFPGDGQIPDSYQRLLDPYIALAFVAAQTSLRIGTCISLIAQHDAIALAKALATLDYLSEGRLTLGVGYGWNREELANHGHEFKSRKSRVREQVELMRKLWTESEAEYHGEYLNLEASWSWPKPAQGSIPVLLGVLGRERGQEAIVQWADGWLISEAGRPSMDWIAARLGELRRRWAEAGRSESGPIIWTVQGIVDDEEFRSRFERLHSLGVAEALISIPTSERDEILPVLDRYAKVLATSFSF
jgi:probable F420-dependent oxidoreductase